MLDYFGSDIGRGNEKAVYGPGEKDFFSIPSYACPAKELDLPESDGDILENLVVTINNQEWFFGEFARRHGGTREFGKDKVHHRNTKPLLIGGVAAAAYMKQEYVVYPKICTLLPISDYKKQAASFESEIIGTYKCELGGKKIHIDIGPGQALSFPECAAMYYDMLMNWQGEVINTELANQDVAFLDFGWKTLNFCVIRKGMQYDDDMSGTMPLGLYKAFTDFYKRISREKDIPIQKAEKFLFSDGTAELKALAQESRDALSIYWTDLTDFGKIYIGGYSAPTMLPLFGALDWVLNLVPNGARANANGAYKIAKNELQDA